MRNRTGMVLCILIGSFCVYCGQSAMTELSHDGGNNTTTSGQGPVGNANADTCCAAPAREQPTVIFDDVVMPSPFPGNSGYCTQLSPVFDVSSYRTVVIHTPRCKFSAQVRNGKAGFVRAVDSACGTASNELGHAMTIDALLGHDLRISLADTYQEYPDGEESCSTLKATPLTIVGYKNP